MTIANATETAILKLRLPSHRLGQLRRQCSVDAGDGDLCCAAYRRSARCRKPKHVGDDLHQLHAGVGVAQHGGLDRIERNDHAGCQHRFSGRHRRRWHDLAVEHRQERRRHQHNSMERARYRHRSRQARE